MLNKQSLGQTLLALMLATCLTAPLAQAQAGERGRGHRGPPPEALDACIDKEQGDVCSFTGRRGEAVGTCVAPPRDEDVLACLPDDRPGNDLDKDAEDN